MENEPAEITGLWKETDKNGDEYLAGVSGRSKWMVFENKFRKEGSNEPTHRLVVVPAEPKAKGEGSEAADAVDKAFAEA